MTTITRQATKLDFKVVETGEALSFTLTVLVDGVPGNAALLTGSIIPPTEVETSWNVVNLGGGVATVSAPILTPAWYRHFIEYDGAEVAAGVIRVARAGTPAFPMTGPVTLSVNTGAEEIILNVDQGGATGATGPPGPSVGSLLVENPPASGLYEIVNGGSFTTTFATEAETITGTSTALAVTPAGDAAALAAYTSTSAAALAAHAADTTAIHGIADTAALVLTGDSRLTNARTPTAHASTHADGGTDEVSIDGSQVTTGTVADARIASTIARDSEVTAAIAAIVYTQVDVYDASATWTKPAWAQRVTIHCIGGGGGGGSGRRGAAGTVRCGGGGGGGGGFTVVDYDAADLPSALSVTIASGGTGAGGALVGADDTSGNTGTVGGAVFARDSATTTIVYARANGGLAGAGGSATAGAGGGGSTGLFSGGAGGTASTTGLVGVAGTTAAGSGGGGSGGGLTTGNAESAGGSGGPTNYRASSNIAAGGAAGTVGGTATNLSGTKSAMPGNGGGGGGSSAASVGGSGGNGTIGGGGGGGGASLNGQNSGAGGNGGSGRIVIVSHL